jgi:endogenous inhibitor of DNA gyrase (YacG/DUF329 family)
MPDRTVKSCGNCGIPRGSDKWTHRSYCPDCWRTYQRNRWNGRPGFPGRAHVWTGDLSDQTCPQCGQVFQPRRSSPARPVVFCSRSCKDRARKDQMIAERELAKPINRICMHCGTALPQKMRTDAIFCSQKCNYGAHALQRKLRARTGDEGKPGYLRAFICNRDKWMCGICGEPVDPELRHPDPRCVSLDHIIPVSHGGSNDLWNLRLTHLVCNLRRRNVVEAHASS